MSQKEDVSKALIDLQSLRAGKDVRAAIRQLRKDNHPALANIIEARHERLVADTLTVDELRTAFHDVLGQVNALTRDDGFDLSLWPDYIRREAFVVLERMLACCGWMTWRAQNLLAITPRQFDTIISSQEWKDHVENDERLKPLVGTLKLLATQVLLETLSREALTTKEKQHRFEAAKTVYRTFERDVRLLGELPEPEPPPQPETPQLPPAPSFTPTAPAVNDEDE